MLIFFVKNNNNNIFSKLIHYSSPRYLFNMSNTVENNFKTEYETWLRMKIELMSTPTRDILYYGVEVAAILNAEHL